MSHAATTKSEDGANKRKEFRQRTLRGARIVFNRGFGVFDCTIRNISPHGAMLVFGAVMGVPTHFDLEIAGVHHRHTCTVRWRTERSLGVSFDDVG